jgi:hypothetical protein
MDAVVAQLVALLCRPPLPAISGKKLTDELTHSRVIPYCTGNELDVFPFAVTTKV